jgi:hypothetical protein
VVEGHKVLDQRGEHRDLGLGIVVEGLLGRLVLATLLPYKRVCSCTEPFWVGTRLPEAMALLSGVKVP